MSERADTLPSKPRHSMQDLAHADHDTGIAWSRLHSPRQRLSPAEGAEPSSAGPGERPVGA